MRENIKSKIWGFVSTYKKKIIVYSCLLVATLVAANILLKRSYEFVISQYEQNPGSVQTCEDGIKTLSMMKYYKNSKNYIKEMKQSIVKSYCKSCQFEAAKQYLDKNYQEGLDYLYYVIEDGKAEFEEEMRLRYMETREGRTKRVYKMYETRGLGGEYSISNVVNKLITNIEYGTLDDIGNLLPVWNRNNKYLDMLKGCIVTFSGSQSTPYSTYYVEDWRIVECDNLDADDYKQYLENRYNISIDVQSVYVVEFEMMKKLEYSSIGSTQRMLIFETDNRYFVGGVYYGIGECMVNDLVVVSDYYRGELDQEY